MERAWRRRKSAVSARRSSQECVVEALLREPRADWPPRAMRVQTVTLGVLFLSQMRNGAGGGLTACPRRVAGRLVNWPPRHVMQVKFRVSLPGYAWVPARTRRVAVRLGPGRNDGKMQPLEDAPPPQQATNGRGLSLVPSGCSPDTGARMGRHTQNSTDRRYERELTYSLCDRELHYTVSTPPIVWCILSAPICP